jgi:signal transduction histidine kinase/ActR/RegA family two-component response regulator
MPPRARRRSVSRRLVAIASVLMPLALAGSAAAQPEQKQVLVLYSTRRDAQIAVVGDRELPKILETGLAQGLDYYSEFLDPARFPHADYRAAFSDFLRLKYQDHRFDLIIAMDDWALEFMGAHRKEVSPDTPVVFFASSQSSQRIPNSAGVIGERNFSRTLVFALELQPEIQHVFFVVGETAEGEFEKVARGQFRPFEPRVMVTYLAGVPTRELEAQLAALPKRSIIYYGGILRTRAGENLNALEYLDRIADIANAPIYSWVDSTMDHGIVGGSLKSQQRAAEAVAQLALRVLNGEAADSIPTLAPDLNVAQVDWRQLRRWGIDEARVPVGTIVLFREPTVWDRYRIYILAGLTLLITQSVLITGLLIQRRRRRRAEEELRGSQGELRRSYERNRDLGGRLLRAQEDERALIARELHDDIGQQVALLTIELSLLGRANLDEAGNLAKETLSRAQDLAKSVQDLSHRLHPARLRVLGLIPALEALRDELSRNEIEIRFTHEMVPTTLPGDLTSCLFRVVQEALQNALKHSKAHNVSVHLAGRRGLLALSIVDDGVGFDVDDAVGKGLGLISMNERLDAVGGSLEIRSKPGVGTELTIRVPLDPVRSDRMVDPVRSDRTAVRVLLVDDNDAMLDRASEVLTPACVIAGRVHDGNAALKAAETVRPDVIVLDISLHDMTGLEVAGHLREAGSTAALVFLTAHDDEAYERAAQALGAAGYVLKSRLASDLLPAVQGARGRQRFEPAVH